MGPGLVMSQGQAAERVEQGDKNIFYCEEQKSHFEFVETFIRFKGSRHLPSQCCSSLWQYKKKGLSWIGQLSNILLFEYTQDTVCQAEIISEI